MSSSKGIGIFVGVTLTTFILVFGTIMMFGLLDTVTDTSPALFSTVYFVFVSAVFGMVYLANTDILGAKWEHVLIIVSILIFSASLATFAGSAKNIYDVNQYVSQSSKSLDVGALQSQGEYYSQYVQSMLSLEDSLRSNNKILAENLAVVTEKLNDRTSIIVENIVTLPPEIIYVEDTVSDTDMIYYDEYEDEYEEDDD